MSTCGSCGGTLPAEARYCPACGAEQETVRGPEERKIATVLFADLVDSTALASDQDPERVRALLDRFYEAMAEEIERTGGTVEKFAGDAVMAVFGAPAALEDHAERALHAALGMQRRVSELFGDQLRLRIGVNTGELIVGQARESSSFVTGDSVNVGARLEQAAEPGEVLAGERSVAAARGAFEFGAARTLEAKGKPGGVVGHSVRRALTLARPRGAGGFERVFVGRESELELLRATFRRVVAQGEPHLVTIVGEPGVGKTRLVRELWEVLAEEEPAPLRRTGRCLPYGDGITYWPLGEVLREHFGILESDRPADARRRLGEREILGLALGLDVAGAAHPLDARERLHASVVAFVAEELAGECPAAILVEDIHWAEDDLLDLLERISREARAPVVLLTTARPELLDRRPTWSGGWRNATTIWLEPLPGDQTSRLLGELLSATVSDELQQLVVERAEGNPFFVEELLGSLVEAGVLVKDRGAWRANDLPAGFSMPDSVHAVLAARMDRLPASEKEALQAASVVGRAFWPGAVSHLLGEEPDLDLLEARDFIRRSGRSSFAGEREYAIKHALTREVAYASIPKTRRGRLHAALADWLEASDWASDEHASLLAYHCSEAVRPEDADLVWASSPDEHTLLRAKAVRWLRRAGELARGRYEMEEAIELFERAIELCDDQHERALLLRALGQTHALRYDGDAMRRTLLRALEGPLDDEERADTYAFLAFQASIRSAMWSIRLNRSLIEEWVEHALELAPGGSDAEVRALVARANAEPAEMSDEELARISRLADQLATVQLRSHAFGARSSAAFDRGRFADAAVWSERRLELLTEVDDPDHLCEAYESAAPVALAVSRVGEARRLAELHAGLARRLSPHHRVHAVSLGLEIGEALGDWATLVADTHRAVVAIEENLATPCVRNPRGFLLLALAHLCTGDEARWAELALDAERLAGEGYDSYLSAPRLRAALERGDRRTAETLLELPLERSFVWGPAVFAARLDGLVAIGGRAEIEREAPELLQAGTYVEPFALRALGWARGDDDLLARADRLFAARGLEWHRAQTERLLAGL